MNNPNHQEFVLIDKLMKDLSEMIYECGCTVQAFEIGKEQAIIVWNMNKYQYIMRITRSPIIVEGVSACQISEWLGITSKVEM